MSSTLCSEYIYIYIYMVRYYGRARQRIGSVNTNQPGLKQAGCPGTVGKQGLIIQHLGKRVNCNLKTCGLPMSGLRCRYGVADAIGRDKTFMDIQNSNNPAIKDYCKQVIGGQNGIYCQWPQPRNRQNAGGVGNIWTSRRNHCEKTCSLGWKEAYTQNHKSKDLRPVVEGGGYQCHPDAPGGCNVCPECCNKFIPDKNACRCCYELKCAPKWWSAISGSGTAVCDPPKYQTMFILKRNATVEITTTLTIPSITVGGYLLINATDASGDVVTLTVNGTIANSGRIVNNGAIFNSESGKINNDMDPETAAIVQGVSGTITNRGQFTNHGPFENLGSIINGGMFINNSLIWNSGGALININNTSAGTIRNYGIIYTNNTGTITNNGYFYNLATINIGELDASGVFNNYGFFINKNGTINNNATINNMMTNIGAMILTNTDNGTINNTGTINNWGTIDNSAGSININGVGTITIEAFGIINNHDKLIVNSGTITNNGIFNNDTGGTITCCTGGGGGTCQWLGTCPIGVGSVAPGCTTGCTLPPS